MPDKKLRVFGDALNGGALIQIKGIDDAVEAHKFIIRKEIEIKGGVLDEEGEKKLLKIGEDYKEKLIAELRRHDIAPYILTLLNASSKKEEKKIAGSMLLDGIDFAHLLFNYDLHGYEKESHFQEYVPDHLIPTEDERQEFHSSRPGGLIGPGLKYLRKIKNIFNERKIVAAHLLTKGEVWHCFFFSSDDTHGMRLKGKSHWANGDHLHYTSHLWGMSKEYAWGEVKKRKYSLSSVHIQYQAEEGE